MQITFQYFNDDHSIYSHQPEGGSSTHQDHYQKTHHRTSPSEAVPVFLPFPGTEPNKKSGEATSSK